jgi:hypothetical protein
MSIKTLKVVLTLAVLVAGSLFSASAMADPATETTAPVLDLATFTVVGTSTVVRNDNGVHAELSAGSLNPGEAYSMWILIFGPDGGDGLTVRNLSGGLADELGNINFAGSLKEGVVTFPLDDNGNPIDWYDVLFEGEFLDARAGFISLVVVNHGPKIPGQVYEQTHTRYEGACANHPVNPVPGGVICQNTLQTTFHRP